MLSDYFLNPYGLWTALALLPLILLYLIRPKPKLERIPSLLFILRDLGRDNTKSFFRNFLKDFLLVLQLLFILFLIAAAAKPYLRVPRTELVEQTVLIIDVSASTQAGHFNTILDRARENLGKENTIILAKGHPEVLGEHLSIRKAENLLDTLEPTDTTTDLTGALQLANQYTGPGTRVVVISDFIPSAGDPDYDTAADALDALGATVVYEPVTSSGDNIGITDLRVGPARSSLWVKNYASRPKSVTLSIAGNEQEVLLAKGETKRVDFDTPTGAAEIRLLEDDALPVDNTVYISTPEKTTVKLLIITNEKEAVEQSKLLIALSVISKNFPTTFEVSYAEPPKLPPLAHDAYLIWNANLDFLLPGHVRSLKESVEEGAAIIFFEQPDLFSLDWQGLLPVEWVNNSEGGRATLIPEQHSLTTDIEFGQIPSHMRVKAAEGTTTIVKTEHDPIVVLGHKGKGSTLYYGIPEASSFTKSPGYPIFWRRAFDLLTHRPSLSTLNLRTGQVVTLTRPTLITTPRGQERTNILALEHEGLYVLPDRTLAANLLSDKEGDLTPPQNLTRTAGETTGEESDLVPRELTNLFLYAALALLFIELLYLKYRGDL
ncbi:VWA domain-containing protein [Candidatus Woesearchaeota archaeon]|nr:MAG: VWA domain-containing protein [Candidatus Woesearchaeota archaeon]